MKPLDLNFICQALNLPTPSVNKSVSRIVTDSRDIRAGDVFFALAGERFDAHDFVEGVLAAGAAVVVSREDCAAMDGALKVDDTLAALQTLAKAWRDNVNPFVFGITGSGGKTTVKEMLAAVLRRRFGDDAVLATVGNFNNHIGLPLTLLKLNEKHRYAVIEMGMNHFGELAVLTQIAKPDAALVNNALRAHVGCGFDGTNDITKAKSEIYQGLGENGLALIPCEDKHAAVFQTTSQGHQQRTFGVDSGDVHAENIVLKPLSCEFDLVCGNERAAVVLPVPGRHNVHNAAAAAALALAAGLSLNDVAEGLKGFSNIKGRLNVKAGIKGATLIDDTYNANPDSMKAAIDVLARMSAPRIFVMGDMGELGEDEAAAMHAEVGAYARDQGIEAAYFVGDERATVLVKGSRFMKMEEVVEALTDKEAV